MNAKQLKCTVIITTILLASCASTKRVTMNTIRPADITLSSQIHTIVLVDRTKFKNQAVNIIEGVLTGELPMEDRAAVNEGLISMKNKLQITDRFRAVIDPNRYNSNSMVSVLPVPLSWTEIDLICKTHSAQAITAIELFDSDFIITDGIKKVKKNIKEGDSYVEREVDEYFAHGVMNIKMGIRIYDNINRIIIDENLFSKTRNWESKADSRADAIAGLIKKSDATSLFCSNICEEYVCKIAPIPISITRKFYRKSKKVAAIEVGSRFADVNKWQDAIDVWSKEINGAPAKEAGYLAYNTAIGYEVLGDYDKAIQWAQDAYTEYNNRKAQSYVSMLRERKESELRVKEQMGSE